MRSRTRHLAVRLAVGRHTWRNIRRTNGCPYVTRDVRLDVERDDGWRLGKRVGDRNDMLGVLIERDILSDRYGNRRSGCQRNKKEDRCFHGIPF